jgi:hypothetical protein
MRQFRTSGSVEGVTGNRHLYSDWGASWSVEVQRESGPTLRPLSPLSDHRRPAATKMLGQMLAGPARPRRSCPGRRGYRPVGGLGPGVLSGTRSASTRAVRSRRLMGFARTSATREWVSAAGTASSSALSTMTAMPA